MLQPLPVRDKRQKLTQERFEQRLKYKIWLRLKKINRNKAVDSLLAANARAGPFNER
jgi:hypothetical protein